MLTKSEKTSLLRRIGLASLIVAVGACAGVASRTSDPAPTANDQTSDDADYLGDEDDVEMQAAELNLTTSSAVTKTYKLTKVKVGKYKSQTISFTNKTGATVKLTTVLDGDSTFTAATDTCNGQSLAKNKTCKVVVKYTPTARKTIVESTNVKILMTGEGDAGVSPTTTCVDGGWSYPDAGSFEDDDAGDAGDASDASADLDADIPSPTHIDGGCTTTPNGAVITVTGEAVESKTVYLVPTGTGPGAIAYTGGKQCPLKCKPTYDIKSGDAGAKTVKLTAKESDNSTFTGWTASCSEGKNTTGKTCTLSVSDNTKVEANFTIKTNYDAGLSEDADADAGDASDAGDSSDDASDSDAAD